MSQILKLPAPAAPLVPVTEVAAQLAVLLAAMPPRARILARQLLVRQVEERLRPRPVTPVNSQNVVAMEISRLADGIALHLVGTTRNQQGTFWQSFRTLVNDGIKQYQFTTEWGLEWSEDNDPFRDER